MKRIMLVLVAGLLLGACLEPKIDASSEETLEASREKVQQSLSEEQRKQFDTAFDGIMAAAIQDQLLKIGRGQMPSREDMFSEIGKKIDKKTGKQIISEFEKIKKE